MLKYSKKMINGVIGIGKSSGSSLIFHFQSVKITFSWFLKSHIVEVYVSFGHKSEASKTTAVDKLIKYM